MAGPLLGILGKAVGAMFAQQVGSGLGGLASEVLSVSDIGLPLAAPGRPRSWSPTSRTFADGLDSTEDDVLLYLALREAAHQRLFAHVPWLRDHLIGAVADYAGGIEVNAAGIQSKIEEQMQGIDPSNPAAMQELLDGGLFDLPRSAEQDAALQRLEVTLALVEGWVDEVVGQATVERMPSAAKLQEAFRRRRAAGGPAEQTFATLVGLELRPRRLRDASTLWGSLRARQGTEARDGVWMHPRPAADRRRPRRPARVPRGSDRTARPQRRGLRRRAEEAPRRVTLHDDALAVPHRLAGAERRPGGAAAAVRRAPAGAPGRDDPRLPARPPHRQHAGGERRRRRRTPDPAREGPGVVPVRRPLRAG